MSHVAFNELPFARLSLEHREIVVAIRDYQRAQDADIAATATDDIQERRRVLNAARDRLGARLALSHFVAGIDCFTWDRIRWAWDREYKELVWVDTRPRAWKDGRSRPASGAEPRARERDSREFRHDR